MAHQTFDLHVNPSDETIRLGPLAVRFLLTGDNSAGSIAVFELIVPGAQRLPVLAHSHDHYEETLYGIDGGGRGLGDEPGPAGRSAARSEGLADQEPATCAACEGDFRRTHLTASRGALLLVTQV